MRIVSKRDLNTAYRLVSDIVDAARSLEKEGKYNPFHYEIVWEKENTKYDICIDVSIKPTGVKHGSNCN